MSKQAHSIPDYKGWSISWDYGRYTATGPNYEAEPDGEGGWQDNGHRAEARNIHELHEEIDALIEDGKI